MTKKTITIILDLLLAGFIVLFLFLKPVFIGEPSGMKEDFFAPPGVSLTPEQQEYKSNLKSVKCVLKNESSQDYAYVMAYRLEYEKNGVWHTAIGEYRSNDPREILKGCSRGSSVELDLSMEPFGRYFRKGKYRILFNVDYDISVCEFEVN